METVGELFENGREQREYTLISSVPEQDSEKLTVGTLFGIFIDKMFVGK